MSNNVPQDLMSLDEISNLLATHPVTMETLAKALQGIVHQLAGSNRHMSILDQGLRGPGNNISALTVDITENATVEGTLTAGAIHTDGSMKGDVVNARELHVTSGQMPSPVLVVTDKVEVGAGGQIGALTVHGHVVLDDQGNPEVYGGTGNQEFEGHLHLYNSPENQSSLGLKAGGVLVSDAYDFANPVKNDLIVKGKIGIGTATPAQTLHTVGNAQVDGAISIGTTGPQGKLTVAAAEHINMVLDRTDTKDHMTLTVGSNGTGIHFGNSNFFFISADKYEERTTRGANNQLLIIKPDGKTGIGVAEPQERLHVAGNVKVDGSLSIQGAGTELLSITAQQESNILYRSKSSGMDWQVGTGRGSAKGGQGSFYWWSKANNHAMALTSGGDLHVAGKLVLGGVEMSVVTVKFYIKPGQPGRWADVPPASDWTVHQATGSQTVIKVNGRYVKLAFLE